MIGGQWRGRRIRIPSNKWPVRPTTDFAREALFNILDNRIVYEQTGALDLFGGTGIHSIELASRGCKDITYVDRYGDSVKFIRSLAKEWDLSINAVQADVFSFVKNATRKWDYIFADPPYDLKSLVELPSLIVESSLLTQNGFLVLEHTSKIKFDQIREFKEARQYGQSVFSFFGAGS